MPRQHDLQPIGKKGQPMFAGHLIFIVIHAWLWLVGPSLALVVTIPLHLIFAVASGKKSNQPDPNRMTHVRCPDCKELVLREAVVCRHCRCKLTPQPFRLTQPETW